jgi:chromosome segregation ATPase
MAVVSEEALKDLPNKDILGEARGILASLESAAGESMTRFKAAISVAEDQVAQLRTQWDAKKAESNAAYEKTLRELHREKIDGAEFVRLRQKIEELKPLKNRREQLVKQFTALLTERRNLLIEWEGVLSEEFLELQRAAKSATRKLRGQVKLEVVRNGDRRPLIDFLEANMGGRKDQVRRAMEDPGFSLQAFAQAILDVPGQLQDLFSISAAQSEGLAQLSLDTRLEFGEILLETTTEVSLNVSAEGQAEEWKKLQDLSKGQKATALLLLLLLDSKSPLVVDQPEDDLDNRFVSAGVVPRIRAAKRQRQFLFATHNANIPVLGDAELIAVLTASGEADGGQGHLNPSEMGAIDTSEVKSLVEELLEGGHSAFEARRKKYRF